MSPAGEHGQRVAANLAAELARRGMSWAELANRMGVSAAVVYRIKRGETSIDSDEMGKAIDVLKIDITTLWE